MKRNYHNCEMVKVDQRDFDEILSNRVDRLSSLEDWIVTMIRCYVFQEYQTSAPYCWVDGCLFLDISKSGHNDYFFLVRGEHGLLSYYVDDENNMYMMRFLD